MRNILFFCLTVFIWIPSTAQEKKNEKSKYYISSEVGAGNYMSYGADLNYILNDKFSFRLGYSGHVRNSKELPYNLTSTVSTPRDVMNKYILMLVNAVYLNLNTTKSIVSFDE